MMAALQPSRVVAMPASAAPFVTLDGEPYAAPFPPRPFSLGPLTFSLAAAVIAINLCAGVVAWRMGSLSQLDMSDKGAGSDQAIVVPRNTAPAGGRLAVLDPPDYLPAGKFVPVRYEQAGAEISGAEATAVVDAIDQDNSIDGYDRPCIACGTRLAMNDVRIVAPEPAAEPEPVADREDDAPPPPEPQPIPYTWDDTPAN